jgi:DNA-binding MarR family transcriptional regulator
MAASTLKSRTTALESATTSWLSVVRAYNLCDAALTQRLAPLGLRIGEHEVLANLLRSPQLTQQQLAERCFVAKSGVSMLVTKMEAADLVQRDADAVDARVKRLSLTADGRRLAVATQKIQIDVVKAMISGTSAHDLKIIGTAMQRASQALEQMLQVEQ